MRSVPVGSARDPSAESEAPSARATPSSRRRASTRRRAPLCWTARREVCGRLLGRPSRSSFSDATGSAARVRQRWVQAGTHRCRTIPGRPWSRPGCHSAVRCGEQADGAGYAVPSRRSTAPGGRQPPRPGNARPGAVPFRVRADRRSAVGGASRCAPARPSARAAARAVGRRPGPTEQGAPRVARSSAPPGEIYSHSSCRRGAGRGARHPIAAAPHRRGGAHRTAPVPASLADGGGFPSSDSVVSPRLRRPADPGRLVVGRGERRRPARGPGQGWWRSGALGCWLRVSARPRWRPVQPAARRAGSVRMSSKTTVPGPSSHCAGVRPPE